MSSTPSPQQLAALQALPQGRGLLLQYHWPGLVGATPACPLGVHIHSQAGVDLLAIGAANTQWAEIWLLEYPDAEAVRAHLNSPAMQSLLAKAGNAELLVASLPHPKMQQAIRLLNRFMPWLPRPRRGAALPENEATGGINPTPAQMQAFEAADQRSDVHMFNLLKFHPRAQYENGDRGRSGRRAYEDGYGKVAMSCFLRLGGRIVALGRYRMTLIGAEGDPAADAWDELAVVQYPNRSAFLHMISNPRYLAALEHRHAGLATTEVWSATPEAACQ